MLVHIIADYGTGDLAFAEVVQRIKIHLPDAEPVPLPVPPYSTLAAGFCIAQLGLNPAPPGTLIYHNVAPRQDEQAGRPGNAGERLAYARLPTGVRVIGVNSGYALSFIKDVAEKLRWAASPAEGSQFRSRDIFPQAAAAIALGLPMALGDEIEYVSDPLYLRPIRFTTLEDAVRHAKKAIHLPIHSNYERLMIFVMPQIKSRPRHPDP